MTGSLISRGPDRWEVQVYIGVGPDGRRHYRSRRVNGSRRWAEKCRRDFSNEVEAEKKLFRQSAGQTVGDLIDICMARGEPTWSPSTVLRQRHIVRSYLAPLREIPLHELSVEDISSHYDKLLAGEYTDGPLAPTTVTRAHGVLRAMLEQAVDWEWLDRNPAAKAHVPRGLSPEPALPQTEDIRPLVDLVEKGAPGYLPDPMFALAIHVTATMGLRQGEVCGLQWRDVDFGKGKLQIRRSVVDGIKSDTSGVYVREQPKTPQSKRSITLPPTVLERLTEAHRHAQENARAAGFELSRQAFILSDEIDGLKPWSPHRISRRWRMSRKRFGLPDVTWHALRHYVATTLLGSGVSIVDVAKRLGDSPKTIALIYAHAIPAQDRASADLLDL
jgi:integrase